MPSQTERTPLLSNSTNATQPATPTVNNTSTAFTLRELNISFPVGVLSAVVGATGAGKSSLLQALLGEMKRISGHSYLPDPANNEGAIGGGSVAYVAQTSWLQNATIRANITFGEPYNPSRYSKVIKACALEKDLETLESGDLTEIGEKGINLSGGQKQRVSLARALYSRASVVLLDDPLSAVDAPTAKHLFEHAIWGIIAAGSVKDVLMVPGVAALVGFDSVEHVLEKATSSSSMSSSTWTLGGDEVNSESDEEDADAVVKDFANGKTEDSANKLIDSEGSSTGAIKSKYYWIYLLNAGGILFWLLVVLFNMADRGTMIFNDYWLKLWAEAYDAVESGNGTLAVSASVAVGAERDTKTAWMSDYYIRIYALISCGWVAVFLTAFALKSWGSYRASKIFHNKLITRIIYAPMRFFDTTPIGRILNRCTKDISVLDDGVMRTFEEFIGTIMDALAVLAVVATVTPVFLVSLVPIFFMYYSVSARFLACQREIKRLDSITRSPIYSMFSETLVGVSTIRAYGAERRFMAENLKRVDTNHRAFFYMWSANRWFGVRVSTIASCLILCSAIGTVAMRDVIGAGLAGLSLTWVLSFSDYLVWIVRIQAQLEMNMNAVERVTEYTEIDQEQAAVIPHNRPPANWPETGSLTISNLEMRYAPEQSPVLSDVSFSIRGGEKVGIVGRTGAGKSSLSLSLFRIVEPSKGTITIDGYDISTIGLFDLRSKITMVPQDPILFAGTIRSNLDPFGEYDDVALWSCLKQVRFLESMQSLSAKSNTVDLERSSSVLTLASASSVSESERTGITLEATVSEGGSNFSQGQRQLLCLARALLKSSKITVFDESTASVDNETDGNIQQAIRGPSFANTTVLSIAHRLRTIADYDKVLVLDKGRVLQFGTPLELMQLGEGAFHQMCVASGEYQELLQMAQANE
ncbi:ATP-dependent bile acid permease [Obelidium mucronatum]|nr:ATP-dependent bile acid permease [Obelidium mucronatum]